eukprot:CAMPEP_0184503022 /NCGR_PEP_ID=MMETSP0113_2-20130426/51636_1 /TAXON_ID=91329 /ORGANISM="Norrisiella sphaerica, Strain BC52" /LENGTH=631 /DNA_ID=CAMNT_0026892425 /DNA_START=2473 /DNA_END=4367 /DNA_ORIENTATION=-
MPAANYDDKLRKYDHASTSINASMCYIAHSIGIDLGTTNSALATLVANQPSILPNPTGSRLTPSVIGVSKQGSFVVGDAAKRQAVVNPENTYFSMKSLIGRKFQTVAQDLNKYPFALKPSPKGLIKVSCPQLNTEFFPEQLSAKVVESLVFNYESAMGSKPSCSVITVPAYFDDAQRNATKDAGVIAGLDVKRIINEPTAASLAYGFDKTTNSVIFVFDAGGGTFDVSLLEAGDGVFEVLKTGGDSSLGGDDIDNKIIDWLCKGFLKKHQINLREDPKTIQRLKEAAEKAKLELSSVSSTSINLPFIANAQGKPKHLLVQLTRDTLNELLTDLIQRFQTPMEEVLGEANLDRSEIDHVILVGGTTRIPIIQDLVKTVLAQDPNDTINPDEVVALGAAIQAGVISGGASDIVLIDVTPLSLGLETLGGINTKLIPRNTSLPTAKTEIFSTAVDNQPSVEINVLQGEREIAANCKPLGTFKLSGIQPAPRGTPQIEVSFQIDVNGILTVVATDKTTGASKDLEIRDSNQRTQEEIDQILQDAQAYSLQDQEERQFVETKNLAEATLFEAQARLQENALRDNPDILSEIQSLIDSLRSAVNNKDINTMTQLTSQLQGMVKANLKDDTGESNNNS